MIIMTAYVQDYLSHMRYLYAEGNFDKEQINKLQLYAKYTCVPVEDKGKLVT
jgi:hypothetical protein